MSINIHNKIEIKTNKNTIEFFNTIFNNIFNKIANLETFFDKIAVGNGFCENFSNNYQLDNFLYMKEFDEFSSQFDPSKNEIFFTKSVKINSKDINSKYITEAGISAKDSNINNPEIYNYFSLKKLIIIL